MKKIIVGIFILFLLSFTNIIYASNVESLNFKVTILSNGSLEVEQTVFYNIVGAVNGTYIDYPFNSKIAKTNINSDEYYEASKINIKSVEKVNASGQVINWFKKVNSATIGLSGVYTVNESNGISKLKIYDPIKDNIVGYKIKYIAENVAVRHQDVGEIYYNFVGEGWNENIKKVNIDIYVPNNKEKIYAWGHGPVNGNVKIISESHVNLQIKKLKANNLVAARIMFDKNVIKDSCKKTNVYSKDNIFYEEGKLAGEVSGINILTWLVIAFIIFIVIYWIYLLIKYEKENKVSTVKLVDEEIFKKYNPLVAGCIQAGRDVQSRDIIAVILNLIEKGNIKHEAKKEYNIKYDELQYKHILKPVKEKESQMDNIEKYIYDWFFERKNEETILYERLQTLPREENSKDKLKYINKLKNKELERLGAQEKSVPPFIRLINNMIVLIAVLVAILHMNDFFLSNDGFWNTITFRFLVNELVDFFIELLLSEAGITFLVLIFTFLEFIFIKFNSRIRILLKKISEHKIVVVTTTILITYCVISVFSIKAFASIEIALDELLIFLAILLTITDNMMRKNSNNMTEEYTKICELRYKIKYNSMLDEKHIQHRVLWGKYLAYGVSFGVGKYIIKQIKDISLDKDLKIVIKNNYSDFSKRSEKEFSQRFHSRFDISTEYNTARNNKINDTIGIGKSTGRGGNFIGGGNFHGGGGRRGGSGHF